MSVLLSAVKFRIFLLLYNFSLLIFLQEDFSLLLVDFLCFAFQTTAAKARRMWLFLVLKTSWSRVRHVSN